MHKIIPYILAACCLCMVASCDTVFDVHPYDEVLSIPFVVSV